MRIGGLASGIDTESIIRDLMNAERIPLDKLEQDKTKIEWKRDAFRDVNRQVAELERLITDMRLTSNTINPKTTTSSMESAVTATASSGATNGSYRIAVEQLATNEMYHGKVTSDHFTDFKASFLAGEEAKELVFTTYTETGYEESEIEITSDDTLETIAEKFSNASDHVRAFYDANTEQFVLETTRSGKYSESGREIEFADNSFVETLELSHVEAQNTKFYYNDGVELESRNNSYTLNGITFNFHNVTGTSTQAISDNGETDNTGEEIPGNPGLNNATITIASDTDKAIENITEIVDKFNELVEALNTSQNEPIYRDYPPLTEAQMEEMSERQIELWEEKARSGLLRREPIISSALSNYRSTWSMTVENDGAFRMLSEIGITTTEDYLDGGKLEIDEDVLRSALEEDAASVQQLLFNNTEDTQDASRGLFNRLEDALEGTIEQINQRAGRGSYTSQMYTMGRELEQVEDRIEAFQDRLQQVEDRYWRQFTAMERAISMMNNQSAMLMSFGGNMQ